MLIRLTLSLFLILGGWAVASPSAQASCEVKATQGTYADGAVLGGDLCDTTGSKYVTLGGTGSSGGFGAATAAAPSLGEGAGASFSFDLAGNARVTLGSLLSGEDQTNNLIMVSGGAVRYTQLVGTGGIPTTATDATTSATILPTGRKTFQGLVTCTGTCVQIQKIYGAQESSATVAKSALVCTLNPGASVATTSATDWCSTDLNFLYWFVVTSSTSGTTPLSAVLAQY